MKKSPLYLLTVSGSKVMLVAPGCDHTVTSVEDYYLFVEAEAARIGVAELDVVCSSQMDMPDTRNKKTLALIAALMGRIHKAKPCCAPDCTNVGVFRIEDGNWMCAHHMQERLNSPAHIALHTAIEEQETFLDEGGKPYDPSPTAGR
jgi:hypothetical protein